MKKKVIIGILAHVDAGKTTLSEALLYVSGKIRTLGRVDHKNTYLDTNAIERERGITIFSKQARFSSENCDFVLLDTPGHVDFSPETERTLSLLDYAVLVISASDGVQNHTRTLWQLLEHYCVPTFIFVNKCDLSINLKEDIEKELCEILSPSCIGFFEAQARDNLEEKLAYIDESLMEAYLSGEGISDCDVSYLISQRKLFPCLFGSALRIQGIEFLLEVLDKYTISPIYDNEKFGAVRILNFPDIHIQNRGIVAKFPFAFGRRAHFVVIFNDFFTRQRRSKAFDDGHKTNAAGIDYACFFQYGKKLRRHSQRFIPFCHYFF